MSTAARTGNGLLTTGLLLTVAAGAFEGLAVGTVLPAVNAELGDLRHYGLVFSAFLLTNLVGVVLAGRWADRSGPARPFVAGAATFAVGLAGATLAPSMLALALARGVQGLGSGVVAALAYYLVQRCYPEDRRPRMLALLSTAWMVAGLTGPALAGWIATVAGWRWVFLGLVPVLPACVLLCAGALRGTGSTQDRPDTGRGAPVLMLAAAAALAVTALATSGAVAIAAGLGALVVGTPAVAAALPRGVPGQGAAAAVLLLAAVGYFAVESLVPLALTAVHAVPIAAAGLVLTAGSITWAAGTWVQARLARVAGRAPVLAGAAALTAAGVAGTGAVAGTPGVPAALAAATWAVAALGMGLLSSTAVLAVLERASPGRAGHDSSGAQLANLLGAAGGTAAGGALVGAGGSTSATGGAVYVAAAVGAVVLVLAALAATRVRGGAGPGTEIG